MTVRSTLAARLRSVGRICARRPHVWLLPIVVMCLIMGLGLWAVHEGAKSSGNAERQKALSSAESAASAMQLSIQDAYMPAIQLADWIVHTRNMTTLLSEFDERVPDWYNRATQANSGISMVVAGRVVRAYPTSMLPPNFDLLTVPGFGEQVLEAARRRTLTLSPPTPGLDPSMLLMSFQVPIYMSNVTEEELWPLFSPSMCVPGVCYNATTRSGWWGGAGMTLDAAVFIRSSGPLSRLTAAGYQVQVWRAPEGYLGETQWSVVDSGNARTQPGDVITVPLPIAGSEWRIDVWRDSWEPRWKKLGAGLVVSAAVVVAVLLFLLLVSWEEHRVLLHTVLPKETIHRMKHEIDFGAVERQKDRLRMIELETPAQHMLTILQTVLAGETPPVSMVVAVQQALQRGQDVYRPTKQAFQSKLRKFSNMDAEVQRALVNQLADQPTYTRSGRAWGSASEAGGSVANSVIDVVIAETPDTPQGPATTVVHGPKVPRRLSHRRLSLLQVLEDRPSFDPTSGNDPGLELKCMLEVLMGQRDAPPLLPSTGRRHSAPLGFPSHLGPDTSTLSPDQLLAHPARPLYNQLDLVLATANTWQFDAYALEEASNGHPLSVLGYWLMHTSGCTAYARMDGAVLARFLQRVEAGYKRNPYHNSRHAADVLQTFHMILQHSGLKPGYVDQLTLLGCYLAAIVHDYEHLGRTNDYLVTTHDKLAFRYNDKSPMENHHLAAAWELLRQPEHNCLAGLTKTKWEKLRRLVIELVLATDMRQHFAIMGQFTALHALQATSVQQLVSSSLETHPSGASPRGGTARTAPGTNPTEVPTATVTVAVAGTSSSSGAAPLSPASDQDQQLSLQMALKCSDLGHLAAPLDVHLKWVSALEEELFLQGDAERAAGLPISPLCDRGKEGVTKSQVGFLEIVVLPVFSSFAQRFTGARPLVQAVVSNYHYWKGKAIAAADGGESQPIKD